MSHLPPTEHGEPTAASQERATRAERTRDSYDAVAVDYAAHLSDELSYKPLDRALLAMVVEVAGDHPIADLGCGPGHVAGWLCHRGARAVGIDLSPGMVAIAARDHPHAEFRVGDLRELPASDAEFGALVALYSLIHLAPEDLPVAAAELHRTVEPGGMVVVAFHVGEEVRHVTDWWGHGVDLDFRFLETDAVQGHLERAGLTVEAVLERSPYAQEVATRRAYVLARRPGGS
jgi:ubiquinone/menaquinone biosynthesis C-methylase UbiE